jgi:CubicO group peptidase (beta-lactamase class C family)
MFDSYVAEAVGEWEAPGLAVAVVKDGELLFARGYGVLHIGQDAPVDEETRFAIGSTTKAMTAAALGMLVDEGRLEWDDRVIDHLPEFRLSDPWLTREVTVRDLLTHRAGLGNADYLWYEHDASMDWIVGQLRFAGLAYSPRASFIYQNIMYAAAGQVVEALSGVAWSEFVRTRIFQPLGMTQTVPLVAETLGQTNVAAPHDRVDGVIVPISNASVDPVAPAGSIWSSVEDMSRWIRMLLAGGVTEAGDRILEEATVEELFRPQTLVPAGQFYPTAELTRPNWVTYGMGWFQHDYRGHKLDFHTGSIDGMVAIAGLVRDQDLGVYVLANRDHVELRHALMYRVLDHFLAPESVRDWSAELKPLYDGLAEAAAEAEAKFEEGRVHGTVPDRDLDEFVGEYRNEMYGSLAVSLRDGALHFYRGEGLQGSAEHWHYNTFRIQWDARWRGSALATFRSDASGRVEGLSFNSLDFSRVRD